MLILEITLDPTWLTVLETGSPTYFKQVLFFSDVFADTAKWHIFSAQPLGWSSNEKDTEILIAVLHSKWFIGTAILLWLLYIWINFDWCPSKIWKSNRSGCNGRRKTFAIWLSCITICKAIGNKLFLKKCTWQVIQLQ